MPYVRRLFLQVIDHAERCRGQCLIGTQSLWAAARRRDVSAELPLTLQQRPCGKLALHCRPWDGFPPERPWWLPMGGAGYLFCQRLLATNRL